MTLFICFHITTAEKLLLKLIQPNPQEPNLRMDPIHA